MRALDEAECARRAARAHPRRRAVPGHLSWPAGACSTERRGARGAGLGMFPGVVRRFSADARVPHMGWDNLEVKPGARLLAGHRGRSPYLYFAHSYYAPVGDATAATCTYSVPYTAVLEHDNVFGVQFHPEKSGPLGLQIVRNFVEPLMLAKRIIPCLDVTARPRGEGRQLRQPARRGRSGGARRSATTNRARTNWCSSTSPLRATSATPWSTSSRAPRAKVFIPLTVGGGIRSVADARTHPAVGRRQSSVNTAAVRRPELIRELSEEFGAQAVVLAIDARRQRRRRLERVHARRPGRRRHRRRRMGRSAAKRWARARSC